MRIRLALPTIALFTLLAGSLVSMVPASLRAGPPATPRQPVPDIEVEEISLDRLDFRAGDPVKITAKINRGTLDEPVLVRCYVDTGRVDQVAETESIRDASAHFNWQAAYDAQDNLILIGAYVEPVAGEINVDNNGLWVVFDAPDTEDEIARASRVGLRYKVPTHKYLTEEAIKLASIPEVTQYAAQIVRGAQVEDNFPDLVYGVSWFFGLSTLWTRHFWDVDKGEDGRGLWGRESALEKGRAYLFGWRNNPGAYTLYEQGDKATAYEYLGRVLHFVEDVSTPAHVHDDAHVIDDDEAEKWGKRHAQEYSYDDAGQPHDGESFYDIIEHAAQLADSLPSDDKEGDTEGFEDPGGWLPLLTRNDIIRRNRWGWDMARPEGMKKLFDRTMPSAMAHAAGVIRLFWRTTHPGQKMPAPATGGATPRPPLPLRQ